MFSDTFTFSGGDNGGGPNNDPFAFTASQENFFSAQNIEDDTSKGLRELEAGVLPYTIAGCARANASSKAFDGGRCFILGQHWQAVVIVGFLVTLEEGEGDIWSGTVCDGTGTISFRYENRSSNFGQLYADDMAKLRPVPLQLAEEDPKGAGEFQYPAKIVGQPQEINGELHLMVSFMRPTDPLDYAATMLLQCASVYLRMQKAAETLAESGDNSSVKTVRGSGALSKDPYDDKPIEIADQDIAACIGSDRLKAVIYRHIMENTGKSPSNRSDNSVLAATVRGFCSEKWSGVEVNEALDQLDEAGVLIYTDDSKNRVLLINSTE